MEIKYYDHLDPVVVKNFLSPEECNRVISHIEINHHKYFNEWDADRVFTRRFGIDPHHEDSGLDFSEVEEIRSILSRCAYGAVEECYKNYNHEGNLYPNALWLVKKNPSPDEPGQNVHGDHDGGDNTQFIYSALVYLNTLDNNGQIFFPFAQFEHCPEQGDLLLFPSGGIKFDHGVKPITQERYSIPMWITEAEEYDLKI